MYDKAIYNHGINSTVTIRGIEYRCDERFFTEKWSKLRIEDYRTDEDVHYAIEKDNGTVYFDEKHNLWVAEDESDCCGTGSSIGEALQDYLKQVEQCDDFLGNEVFESIQLKYWLDEYSEDPGLVAQFWIEIVGRFCW